MKKPKRKRKCTLWYWWSYSAPKSSGPRDFVESTTGSRRGAESMRIYRIENGQTVGPLHRVTIFDEGVSIRIRWRKPKDFFETP